MANSNRVRNQANRIKNYSDPIKTSINKTRRNVKDSRNYWEGYGLNVFEGLNNTCYKTGRYIETNLFSIERMLKNLAQKLEREEREKREARLRILRN